MAVALLILLNSKVSVFIVSALLLIIGLASAYQTVVLYYASLSVPEKIAGLTMACVNMIMLIFGYFFHTALGALIDYSSSKNPLLEYGVPIYSSEVFQQALSLLPITLFLAAAGFLFMQYLDKKRNIKNIAFELNK